MCTTRLEFWSLTQEEEKFVAVEKKYEKAEEKLVKVVETAEQKFAAELKKDEDEVLKLKAAIKSDEDQAAKATSKEEKAKKLAEARVSILDMKSDWNELWRSNARF